MKHGLNEVQGGISPTEGTKYKEVLKLVVSAHICVSTQKGLISLQCHWVVLKCVSFALNKWMPSLLFTSRKCFKTTQKQVYKKRTNTESNNDVLAYLVLSFGLLLASPTSKQVYDELKVQDIDLSGSPCTHHLSIKQLPMLLFCLPKLAITRHTIAFRAIHTTTANKPATWLAEGHVTAIKHLESSM